MITLGIETSCDDTSIAIIKGEGGLYSNPPAVLSHKSFSQDFMLKKWGGVVPEIAARNHLAKLVPLLDEVVKEAQIKIQEIDLIGVTTHPGLLGPLLTGMNTAKTLAMLIKKPMYPVNHLYAHLEAIHLTKIIPYPYLGLIVSGGHSIYLLVDSPKDFTILGSTIDDASGEAFDKGAKMLGLGYPGGKALSDNAIGGDDKKFSFPIGLTGSGDANLSFSGLKTALRVLLEKSPDLMTNNLKDICASYQQAIVEALKKKMKFALNKALLISGKKELPIVVGGGVAANQKLREVLEKSFHNVNFVKFSFCTDNGAMIANYALRRSADAIPYPKCLQIDAFDKFIKIDQQTKEIVKQ